MKFIVRLFKENEYDMFEQQKIITESKKIMFEILTHSFVKHYLNNTYKMLVDATITLFIIFDLK